MVFPVLLTKWLPDPSHTLQASPSYIIKREGREDLIWASKQKAGRDREILLLNLNMADFALNSHYTNPSHTFTLQSGLASHFNTTEPDLLNDLACDMRKVNPVSSFLNHHYHVTVCASTESNQPGKTCHQVSNLPADPGFQHLCSKLCS